MAAWTLEACLYSLAHDESLGRRTRTVQRLQQLLAEAPSEHAAARTMCSEYRAASLLVDVLVGGGEATNPPRNAILMCLADAVRFLSGREVRRMTALVDTSLPPRRDTTRCTRARPGSLS